MKKVTEQKTEFKAKYELKALSKSENENPSLLVFSPVHLYYFHCRNKKVKIN